MTKKCKSCQSDIDAKAKKCPNCRADQRNWFKRHPIITGLLVLILIGSVVSAAGGSKTGNTTVNTASNGDNTPTVANQTPTLIDATELVAEYDKNKLAAQDKYNGKSIQTTAFIQNISSDIAGSYYISLKPSNDQYYVGTTIQCYFNDKAQLTSLENGQSVSVTGTMQDMSLGLIMLKDCNVAK